MKPVPASSVFLSLTRLATSACALALATASPAAFTAPIPSQTIVPFSYVGADQTFVVPSGVTSLKVKLWGAGGGSAGGSGAFVTGDLAVTPGETLTLIVGQGGIDSSSATTYGGGGGGGDQATSTPGSGGGRSAIRRMTTEVVTASAGGRGHIGGNGGGAGGLTLGGDGVTGLPGDAGKGGTQTAGGRATLIQPQVARSPAAHHCCPTLQRQAAAQRDS